MAGAPYGHPPPHFPPPAPTLLEHDPSQHHPHPHPHPHPHQQNAYPNPTTPLPNPTSPPQPSPQAQQAQQQMIQTFWNTQMSQLETLEIDFKNHPLPLARIKKVMKTDQDVKMISAEAPLVFSKACEIFIAELTMRAWLHAEENKRRTLQRSDIANAVQDSDQYDFLIDIVPREDFSKGMRRKDEPFQFLAQTAAGLGYGHPVSAQSQPPSAQVQLDPATAYYNQIPQYPMGPGTPYQTPPGSSQPHSQPAPYDLRDGMPPHPQHPDNGILE